MNLKRPGLLAATALLLSTALAGLAWACTPQPAITVAATPAAAAQIITVKGGGFKPEPVELHWDDKNGPVLAVVSGPEFEIGIPVPRDAEAGHYFIVAAQTGARAAETIEVTGGKARASVGQADLWSGFSRAGSPGEAGPPQSGSQMPPAAAAAGIGLTMLGAAAFGFAMLHLRPRRAASRKSRTG